VQRDAIGFSVGLPRRQSSDQRPENADRQRNGGPEQKNFGVRPIALWLERVGIPKISADHYWTSHIVALETE
jgi:hypothetical protein